MSIDDDAIPPRDRRKRPRTAFTTDQVRELEREFNVSKYLSVNRRQELSKRLGLTDTQVGALRFPILIG